MRHEEGEVIIFVAQRRCQLRYSHYKEGEAIKVTLRRDWNEEDGLGDGGPWGWGGYSSHKVDEIAGLIEDA